MKTRSFALVIVLTAAAMAQSTSTISGRVILADDGFPLSDAPIQAKNMSTGVTISVRSAQDGKYVLGGLAAGSYEVSASYPGLVPFHRPDVAVGNAESVRIDIRIEPPDGQSLGE